MLKIISLFAALSIVGMTAFTTSAHNNTSGVSRGNQSGIRLITNPHLNGNSFKYDIYVCSTMTNNNIIPVISSGAAMWSPQI